jgi:hypothetical protein
MPLSFRDGLIQQLAQRDQRLLGLLYAANPADELLRLLHAATEIMSVGAADVHAMRTTLDSGEFRPSLRLGRWPCDECTSAVE